MCGHCGFGFDLDLILERSSTSRLVEGRLWQCELTHMKEIMTLMNVIHYAHISSFEEKGQTWRERMRERMNICVRRQDR